MSNDEELGESDKYLTKWGFPAGHNHPSGGILNKEQMFFFSAINTASAVVAEIEDIIGALNAGYDKDRLESRKEELHLLGNPTDKKSKNRRAKILTYCKLTREEIYALEHKANMIMIKSMPKYASFQTDYSVSVEGTGRKQATGISSSVRSGVEPEPDNQSFIDKLFGKNKPEDNPAFPFQKKKT